MHGIIFDCDGVLVDSEKWSCRAWLPVLQQQGIQAELADIQAFIGKSDQAVLDHFRRQTGTPLPAEMISAKEREYFELARGRLETFPGLRGVLEELTRRGLPLAVASSGRPDKIRFSLEQVDLDGFFAAVCSVTEVERGKPAPDLFLYTAAQLDLDPGYCVVIEDSIPGIQAACRARMHPLGFTSSHPAMALRAAGARHTFGSYETLFPLLDSLSRQLENN